MIFLFDLNQSTLVEVTQFCNIQITLLTEMSGYIFFYSWFLSEKFLHICI